MKKLFLILLVGMFAMSLVAAAEWDNRKFFDKNYGPHGRITIKNALGFGKTLATIQLMENTAVCSDNYCTAQGKTTLYIPGKLIDAVKFTDPKNKRSQNSIEDYIIKIKRGERWFKYDGRVLRAGSYEWKIEGKLNPGQSVDWIAKWQGINVDEWAVWTSEYHIRINASAIDISAVQINNVIVTDEGNGLFKLNTTESDYEVARAQVLKTLFYGTDGTDPRVLNMTGVTQMFSVDDRDEGKRGHFWNWLTVSNTNAKSYVGNFNDTTNNFNMSSWSSVARTTSATETITFVSGASIFNTRTTIGTNDFLGKNTVTNQTDNPATVGGTWTHSSGASVGADTSKGIVLAAGNMTWTTSTFASYVAITDFFLNHSIPAFQSAPLVTITNPDDNLQAIINTNISFSSSITSTAVNLTNSSLFLDGVINETINITGTSNTSEFNLSFASVGNIIWSIQACNENGICSESANRTLIIDTFATISTAFKSQIFVTEIGKYSSIFETNASVTSDPTFTYNNVNVTATLVNLGGGSFNISATRTARSTDVGNATFFFTVNTDSVLKNTTLTNQTVDPISLINCTDGNVSSYLHINFLDETTLGDLNATVSSSVFTFQIDDEAQAQTFLFTSTTEEPTYDFCFSPDNITYTADIEFPFLSTGYPQRVFRADNLIFPNTTTNKTLYLLSDADGFFTQYAAINSLTGAAVEGVEVTVQKDILGIETTVAQGITDDTGLLILWLDPDDLHTFTFVKVGFNVNEFSIRPASSDTYQIAMVPTGADSGTQNGTDVVANLSYIILPSQLFLENSTTFTFSFNVTRLPPPSSISMSLSANGTTFFTSSTGGNGILSTNINTGDNTSITGIFTVVAGSETLQLIKVWTITEVTEGDFSLTRWLRFGNELAIDSIWWSLFKYLLIMTFLITLAYGTYYVDPLDSSAASIIISIVVVWFFGLVGWLTLDTPLGSVIDDSIIPALYSLVMISLILWRYKSQ